MQNLSTFIKGGVCAPSGFMAAGTAAGLKKSGKLDFSLIYSKTPAVAAGVFTKNKVKAAPLVLTKQNLNNGFIQAIITNSGNANACTGKPGMAHARQTARAIASGLNIDPKLIAVASTGVIGVPLPIDKLLMATPQLAQKLSVNGSHEAAQAILTTDTFIKENAIQVQLSNGSIVTIGGIAKGSGMIHPNMATMLGFITTDVNISRTVLHEALVMASDNTFNMISVDGDSSTNDMVLILANKYAKNHPITSLDSRDGQIFYEGLLTLCTNLAKQIATDGEGATKLITVNVSGSKTLKLAKLVAKSVVSSSLVKAAIFGNDANWGRIACAIGYSSQSINPNKINIAIEDLLLFKNGLPLPFSNENATKLLQKKEVFINIDLGSGTFSSTAWGCDMTYDYVKINAAYRT